MILLPQIGLAKKKGFLPQFLSSSFNLLGGGNNSMLITKPSGVASGDLMVFFWWATMQHGLSPPVGWVVDVGQDQTFESTNHRAEAHHLVAGGSEPADYTWNMSGGSGSKLGVILAYRYVHATQLDTGASSATLAVNSGSHIQPSINTVHVNSMLVYAWMFNRQSGAALGTISAGPGGMTQRFFQTFSSVGLVDLGVAVYDEIVPAAGATGTRTLTTTETDVSSLGIQTAIRAQGT